MRKRLALLLFDEDNPEAGQEHRSSPGEPAKPSPSAQAKAASKSATDATPTQRKAFGLSGAGPRNMFLKAGR